MKIYTSLLTLLATIFLPVLTTKAQQDSLSSVPFNKPLSIVSAHPDHPLVAQDDATRCFISADPKQAPLIVKLVPGLKNRNYISFESVTLPGHYLRHWNGKIYLTQFKEEEPQFSDDATFKLIFTPNGDYMFESTNYPNSFISVLPSGTLIISSDSDPLRRAFTFKAEQGAAANP